MTPVEKSGLPAGVHAVTPHLCCDGASAAIEFYKAAFGAEELMRLPGEDGRLMHACLLINGSSIFLNDEYPEQGGTGPKRLGGSPVIIHLMVQDVDAAFETAIAAGATVVMPVADMFWGDRYGVLADPFGHLWSLATPNGPMSVEDMQSAMKAM